MKKIFILAISLALFSTTLLAQNFSTRKGFVSFTSDASEENINASNNDVAAVLNPVDGKGQFIIPIKSFKFKKALMQEHFNENYMDSDKYPKATYKYTVTDIKNVNFAKPGKYKVNTQGTMTIKQTTKNIEVPGYIIVNENGSISIQTEFNIVLADYGVEIPKLVEKKIAKQVKIKVDTALNK